MKIRVIACLIVCSLLSACAANPEIQPGLLTQVEMAKYTPETQQQLALAKTKVISAENKSGANSVETAAALNELGKLYLEIGGRSSAEAQFRRALGIYETAHGTTHPNVISTLDLLGEIHKGEDDFAIREPLFQRILAAREKNLAVDHPDLIPTLVSLAEQYNTQGVARIPDVASHYQRAIKIAEAKLGAEHATTKKIKNALWALRGKVDLLKFLSK